MNKSYWDIVDLNPNQKVLQESTRSFIWKKIMGIARKTYKKEIEKLEVEKQKERIKKKIEKEIERKKKLADKEIAKAKRKLAKEVDKRKRLQKKK